MAGENDTLPNGGTENASLTHDDTFGGFNFIEQEVPENDERDTPAKTDSETAKASDTGEPDAGPDANPDADEIDTDDDATDDGDDGSNAATTVKDDVVVRLADGKEVPLGELKRGYLRQADFSRKTMELANSRKSVSEQAERIGRIVETFTDYLARQIPNEPDYALAVSNPQQYVAQKAQYDAAIGRIQELIGLADAPREVTSAVNGASRAEMLAEQNRLLAEAIPATTNPKGREAFFTEVMRGAKEAGFTQAEIANVADHRLLMLGYYAAKGLAADKAKATAKAKVADVPPVAPPKRQRGDGSGEKYVDAMRSLSKSGSVEDAARAYLARRRA